MSNLNNFNKVDIKKLEKEYMDTNKLYETLSILVIFVFSSSFFGLNYFFDAGNFIMIFICLIFCGGSFSFFFFLLFTMGSKISNIKRKIDNYNLEVQKELDKIKLMKKANKVSFEDETQEEKVNVLKGSFSSFSDKDLERIEEMIMREQLTNGGEFNSEGKLFRYKSGNGVEGIVVGKEYEKIDKNKDGHILISEMYPLSEEEVLEKILAVDSNFSKTQFKSYVRALFMLLQKAWSNNNYHALRAIESDNLYYEHRAKIEELILNNCYDKRENIGIRGCLLKEFKIEGDKEVLVVALTARMLRSFDGDVFRLKEAKKKLTLFGDNVGTVPYIMTFMRNKGVKTKTGVPLATSNCSNCGAVINVDDNGVCTYCNTSLVSGEVDWVLVDIKNIELVEQ